MPGKSDNRVDVAVAQLAASEWSVLSLAELLRCGLSRGMVETRIGRAQLHPLHQVVYAVGHPSVPLEGRFLAAVKACGLGAVLSHFSAAALWEMVDWDERHLEVTVEDTTPRVHAGIRAHRTRFLEAKDVRQHRGIPITSPARTALDLCSQLPEHAARRAIRKGLSDRHLSVRNLVEILDRQARRPGAKRIHRIVVAAGLPRPDVNVAMRLDARRLVPDFRWPDRRLIVEADSRTWHDNKLAREDDAERQALLEAHGERIVRVTWEQAISDRTQTMKRLRAAAGL